LAAVQLKLDPVNAPACAIASPPSFLRDAWREWLPEYREVEVAPRYTMAGQVAFANGSADGRKGFCWLGWPEKKLAASES
jgi:hypothetical protein